MSVGYLKKCSNGRTPKNRHLTQASAEGERERMIRLRKWTRAGSNTYWCNECGFYHAGSLGRSNRGGGRQGQKAKPRHFDLQ